MKLQFILARIIVILFMTFGEFPRGIYISLIKFGLVIYDRRVHQNGFLFILVGPNILIAFLG